MPVLRPALAAAAPALLAAGCAMTPPTDPFAEQVGGARVRVCYNAATTRPDTVHAEARDECTAIAPGSHPEFRRQQSWHCPLLVPAGAVYDCVGGGEG